MTGLDSTALVVNRVRKSEAAVVKRLSGLNAPVMRLEGHSGDVTSCQFNSDGSVLATASSDRSILLWKASGNVANFRELSSQTNVGKGHQAAVLQAVWNRDSSRIYSCGVDSVVCWDVESGTRLKRLPSTAISNACCASRRGPELLATVCDDGLLRLWDVRVRTPIKSLVNPYPLTAVAFALDGDMVFCGGIQNIIHGWDLRSDSVLYSLNGHSDSITGLSLNSQGDLLLSNAMDNSLRVWNVKPFCVSPSRLQGTYEGAPHGFEKNLSRPCWSPDSEFIACGSADRTVVVWDVASKKMVYKLPGHKGCVNQVDWSVNSLLASASSDKTVFIGELNVDEVK